MFLKFLFIRFFQSTTHHTLSHMQETSTNGDLFVNSTSNSSRISLSCDRTTGQYMCNTGSLFIIRRSMISSKMAVSTRITRSIKSPRRLNNLSLKNILSMSDSVILAISMSPIAGKQYISNACLVVFSVLFIKSCRFSQSLAYSSNFISCLPSSAPLNVHIPVYS